MKMLNQTLALCCAALLFAAGCTNTAETTEGNNQDAVSEQSTTTTEPLAAEAKKKTEVCDDKPAEEGLKLCATYQENPNDKGYTIYVNVDVPNGASFEMSDGQDLEDTIRVITVKYTTDQSNNNKFSDSIVVSDQQAQNDKETHIRVELHEGAKGSGKSKDDKDLKRKVLIPRSGGTIVKEE